MPLRSERVHRYVTAFCPSCHHERPDRPLTEVRRLAGYLADVDGRVWLVRGCPDHGRVVTLYDEDVEILSYLEEWTAPTKVHVPDTPGNYDPVPAGYLRGLPELQTQHTCILLEDVTEGCNLRCPTCFAGSSPELTGVVPAGEVLANVEQRLEREGGRLDVLMLSGGEPTLHPEFLPLLRKLVDLPIVRIIVNSNGVTMARDDELVGFLADHAERIEVYLQFDGFRRETSLHHRGADLRAMKERAIERLTSAGVFVTLTMTVSLGVNDDEIGDVVRLALDTPFVGGVSIQPQFGSGRSTPIDPLERLTHTGVLARLGPQTGGVVAWRDLTALPCSHPHCCSIGYLFRLDSGEWRSLAALVGHDRLKEHLGLVSNRIADTELPAELRASVRSSLLGLLSEQSSLGRPDVGRLLREVCEACDLGVGTLMRMLGARGSKRRVREVLATRVKRITVKPFMDIHTMIEERLLQCCVHVGTRDEDRDQCAPFCAVQAWAPLAAQRMSTAAAAHDVPLAIGRKP
ncbi:MAG: radical SAM protein [Acidimicrobiia bacterium]|nr:radical SAM protein [Acidimicrobiia bacterium]